MTHCGFRPHPNEETSLFTRSRGERRGVKRGILGSAFSAPPRENPSSFAHHVLKYVFVVFIRPDWIRVFLVPVPVF